ncbi:MAG: hypothetical protein ACHQYP_06690 [Nitrospiria bacterium]
MTFIVAAALFLLAVVVFLFLPFWTKTESGLMSKDEASRDEERINLNIEKESLLNSLSELEVDFSQEKLPVEEYHRLKSSYEHRLVQVLKKLDVVGATAPKQGVSALQFSSPAVKTVASLFLAGIVLGGTFGAYKLIYGKIEKTQRAAYEAASDQALNAPNPMEMVARVEKRLKENPNNIEDQVKVGRAYMALQRWTDAEKAWRKVIELDERNEIAQYNLADILLRTAPEGKKEAYQEALNHIEKALINVPREPVVLWAKGVALLHLGRTGEADEAWTTAFQNLPTGSKDAEYVKQALEALRSGKPIP